MPEEIDLRPSAQPIKIGKFRFTRLLIGCVFFLLPSISESQNILDFKELWIQESREFLLNNQRPLPYLQSGFYQFSRQWDENFLDSLNQEWSKFQVNPGIPVPKSRKFEPSPEFVFEEASYHNPQFLPCFLKEGPKDFREEVPFPRVRKPESIISSPLKITFRFFGNNVTVSYDRMLALKASMEQSKESVAEFWQKFTVANSNHLIGQLMSCKDRLGLNDWGYFLLVKHCSTALYPNDPFSATTLTWALMIRSGFDVRIGYNQLGVSILFPVNVKIYNIPSIKIGNRDFYIDYPIASFPIFTYNFPHEGANNPLNLILDKSLNFQGESELRKIQFNWNKKLYVFDLKYNPEIIRFLEEYPATSPEICFNTPFTALSNETLSKQLKPIVTMMKKEEAVAFLQQFVQKTYAYFPYNDLYGHDRFMFPEELLFKEEGNDKGKSLLFAWLITHILNQKAALVEFPGFWSAAVALDQPLDGDNFLVDGRRYTLVEPTFLNAPIGLVMKEFYPLKPILSILKNPTDKFAEQDRIWKLANAFGAKRSGVHEDFIKDDSGNSYITGYLNETITNLSSPMPVPFIAKFDLHNSLNWMIKFRSTGKAYGLELKELENGELYISGSFRGQLEVNGQVIQSTSSNPDLFFAQFNSQGELFWLTKAGLDQLEEESKLFYQVQFTRAGEIKSVKLSNEDERCGKTGFRNETNEGLCYIASRYQTIGLDREADEPLSGIQFMKQNLHRMQELGIDPFSATLVTLFRSLIYPGSQVGGELLTVFNSDQNHAQAFLKSNLSKIKSLKNKDGIVEVYTLEAKGIRIAHLQIANHAKFMLLPLDNNDFKLIILNGFTFELGSALKQVNVIITEPTTGNVILDIGAEHTIITKQINHTQ